MSWAKAAQHWGQELTHRPNADQSGPEQLPFLPELYEEKKKLRAQMLEKLEQYSDILNNVQAVVGGGAEPKGKEQQQHLGFRHAGRERLTPALVANIKTRKYSREERNRRRLEAKKDGEIDDKK
uniref:Mediator of RNA polymerase II transcription subunit 7 n=1 Tax=Globodera pallida TaxID=36090 RepID=A0A183CAK7_GLOPA